MSTWKSSLENIGYSQMVCPILGLRSQTTKKDKLVLFDCRVYEFASLVATLGR
jgi:hypothetical protein